jgi:hypothetical protein
MQPLRIETEVLDWNSLISVTAAVADAGELFRKVSIG